ncbi:MAG: DUF1835 domain-containing protein [Chitinophagaceae bacterium]|nr:DUF1835 domain-containing protein [Chitinophagaceae bacterium]
MIHIVFQEADVAALQKSFDLDEAMRGDIVEIKDDFAVGPIVDIYNPEAVETRKQWWREILAGGDYDGLVDDGHVDDQKTVRNLVEKLKNDEQEIVWIWAAQNKHDVSGYYWLISQLKDFQGRIFLLYLNNLPFINEKGSIFYPENLFSIPPREFIKAKKLARPVTLSEFEIDPDEWIRLQNENKGVRILEGGKKLVQYDYNFYDNHLMKFISSDWQKASRLIHTFLNKAAYKTGDAFLLWRLKGMIDAGELDMQGEKKNMKDFEVKMKSAQATIAE